MHIKRTILPVILGSALLGGCADTDKSESTDRAGPSAASGSDFVGDWRINEICNPHTADPSDPSYVGPGAYKITQPNSDGIFGFVASKEFGNPEWNNLELTYSSPANVQRPSCEFDCTPKVSSADVLQGSVTLGEQEHNVTIYLLEHSNKHNGKTAPMIRYEHVTGEMPHDDVREVLHDGWMH